MKKILASFLIASVLWASVIAPARAFLPLAAIAYLTGATSGLNGALVGSVLLHAGIAAIVLTSDGNQPAANGSNAGIQIQLDPYTPLTTPDSAKAPATVPATANQQVVSTTESHSVYLCPTDLQESQSACLSALNQAYCCSIQYDSIVSETSTNYIAAWHRVYESGGGQSTFSKSTVAGCPSGSTWNGSACVQTTYSCNVGYTLNTTENICYANNPDETQVADAKIQIQRILDDFVKNPNDPDPVPPNVAVAPKDITIQTPDRTTSLHINGDGTIDVKEIVHTPDGNTEENKVKASAPSAGQSPEVISKSSNQYPGQSSAPPLSDGSPGGPVVPGTGSGESGTPTGSATPVQVLKLPDGLAQSDKQCGYDAEHPCKVEGTLKLNEQGTPESFDAPQVNLLDEAFDNLTDKVTQHQEGVGAGLEYPLINAFTGSTCVDPVFNASDVHTGAVATMRICEHAEEVQPFLRFAAYLAAVISIYAIWFARQGGTA